MVDSDPSGHLGTERIQTITHANDVLIEKLVHLEPLFRRVHEMMCELHHAVNNGYFTVDKLVKRAVDNSGFKQELSQLRS